MTGSYVPTTVIHLFAKRLVRGHTVAMDSGLLQALKRIQALASTGLFYTSDEYDKERFD